MSIEEHGSIERPTPPCSSCGVHVETILAKGMCKTCYHRQWRAAHPDYHDKWDAGHPHYNTQRARGPRPRAQARRRRIERIYGISMEERDAMIASQGGTCLICKSNEPSHIDHDHTTGRIRGMLCAKCNLALGGFEDSIELLSSAIEYLSNE